MSILNLFKKDVRKELSYLVTESKGVRAMINSYYKALDDWGLS